MAHKSMDLCTLDELDSAYKSEVGAQGLHGFLSREFQLYLTT